MKLQPKSVRTAVSLAAAMVVFFFAPSAQAATIIKLSLGGDPAADVQYAGGIFSTKDDLDGGTTGQQDTAAEFLDFLNGQPDVATPTASYTLSGVIAIGPANNSVFPLAIQGFTGGNFSLYDPSNVLLLSGALGNSTLAGTIGAPSTAALFTTSVASVTGGTLAPLIAPNSLTLSISMTDVNSGAAGPGLQLIFPPGPAGPILLPFEADVTQTIAGEAPEPSGILLAMLGSVLLGAYSRRRT
jgi:hypothetical protein